MNRRTLLAATGVTATAPLAGCLDGDDNSESDPEQNGSEGNSTPEDGSEGTSENRKYEECHHVSIGYERLPDEIQREVDAAIDDGSYESETLRFDEAVDSDRSYVVLEDTPYDPVVETDGTSRTLELHEDSVVRLPEPRAISVRNSDTRDHELRIEMVNGDTIIDETVAIEAGKERELEATDKFGTYELTVRSLTGHEDADSLRFRVGDASFDGLVDVSAERVFVTQEVADIGPCPWEHP